MLILGGLTFVRVYGRRFRDQGHGHTSLWNLVSPSAFGGADTHETDRSMVGGAHHALIPVKG